MQAIPLHGQTTVGLGGACRQGVAALRARNSTRLDYYNTLLEQKSLTKWHLLRNQYRLLGAIQNIVLLGGWSTGRTGIVSFLISRHHIHFQPCGGQSMLTSQPAFVGTPTIQTLGTISIFFLVYTSCRPTCNCLLCPFVCCMAQLEKGFWPGLWWTNVCLAGGLQ